MSVKTDLKGIKVDIEDEETNEIIESFFIRTMSVASSARRYALFEKIKAENHPPNKFNNLVYCANMSVVLCNVDGDLLYPEPTDDTEDEGYLDLHNNYDETIFYLLVEAYQEVNPIRKNLKAKKKMF